MIRKLSGCVFASLLVCMTLSAPVAAQVLEPGPQPFAFPVLGGDTFSVDPQSENNHRLFRLGDRSLDLRATAGGWIDMEAYCKLPERHWGPVTLVNCTLEVSGQKPRTGPFLPARISLADLSLGSTVKLKLLLQAPLIVLDLDGNPTAVLDTFVEEYTWRVTATGGP
jgi:hypothetical protein